MASLGPGAATGSVTLSSATPAIFDIAAFSWPNRRMLSPQVENKLLSEFLASPTPVAKFAIPSACFDPQWPNLKRQWPDLKFTKNKPRLAGVERTTTESVESVSPQFLGSYR
jgi:hypothetical protein